MATVQLFWHGSELSPYEHICLQSFLDFGHNVHIYAYDDLNIPVGVELLDAGEITPASSYFDYVTADGRKTPSAFSNIFRYKLLYMRGGWWIDADVACLTADIPEYEVFFAWESPNLLGSAVLFAQVGHPLMAACAEAAVETVSKTGGKMPWGTIGPKLLTAKVKEMGYADEARDTSICYPIHYSDALDFLRPTAANKIAQCVRDSMFVHLWNELLVREHIDKAQRPPDGSYLRTLADQHSVGGWHSDLPVAFVEALSERSALRSKVKDLKKELEERSALRSKIKDLEIELDEKKTHLSKALSERSALISKVKDLEIELDEKKNYLSKVLAASQAKNTQLQRIYASRSWKITAPLRVASKVIAHKMGAKNKPDKT